MTSPWERPRYSPTCSAMPRAVLLSAYPEAEASVPAVGSRLFFPETDKAVLWCLSGWGHLVEFPLAQFCCGQRIHTPQSANLAIRRSAISWMLRGPRWS
jgi:hypothetical protein